MLLGKGCVNLSTPGGGVARWREYALQGGGIEISRGVMRWMTAWLAGWGLAQMVEWVDWVLCG